MLGYFLVTLVATIVLMAVFIKTIRSWHAEKGEGVHAKNVSAAVLFTLITLVSFACLEAFARVLAVWAGVS